MSYRVRVLTRRTRAERERAIEALTAADVRIAIAGVSGSGKSTLATRLSGVLGLPYVELDSLHWGPGWTPRPEFADEVRHRIAAPRWVTEYQYRVARPLIMERATVLLWLDPPFAITLGQVVARTVRRRVRREVLWNGNTEPGLLHALFHREGIIRWAVSTRNKYGDLTMQAAQQRPDLLVLRLGSRRAVGQLLAALTSTTQESRRSTGRDTPTGAPERAPARGDS